MAPGGRATAGAGDRVEPAGRPGVAAADPRDREHGALGGTVRAQRAHRVVRARRVVAAAGAEQRADQVPVQPQQPEQKARIRAPGTCSTDRGLGTLIRLAAASRSTSRSSRQLATRSRARCSAVSSAASRSRASVAEVAAAAGGSARSTSAGAGRQPVSRAATRARSRRTTVWRTTEPPTALLTTNPARAPVLARGARVRQVQVHDQDCCGPRVHHGRRPR